SDFARRRATTLVSLNRSRLGARRHPFSERVPLLLLRRQSLWTIAISGELLADRDWFHLPIERPAVDYDLDIIVIGQFVHNVRDGGNVTSTAAYADKLFDKYNQLILDNWAQTGRDPLTAA